MKFSFRPLALVMCLAAVSPLGAQESPKSPEAPKQEPGRHIRGLAFRIEEALDTAYVYGPKVQSLKIEIKSYLNDIASTIPFEAGTDLILTNSADPSSVNDPAAVLAKVKFDSSLKSGVFMFLPGTNKPGDPKYRVLVLEDSTSNFPAGSLKLMNLSRVPVRMRLETKDFDVKSGEITVIKNPPMGDNQHAAMTVATFKDGKWQTFGNSVLPAPGRARVFQVFYENSASGKVELRGIRDVAFGGDDKTEH